MQNKITAFILALSILAPGAPVYAAETADAPADIDVAAYADLLKNHHFFLDENEDGVISDAELEKSDYISLDLTDVKDISWFAKLKNCRQLSLTGGDLIDFSVLSEMPALFALDMKNVPITDLSFMDSLQLEYCTMDDMPQITTEQRMAKIKYSDVSMTAGTDGWITVQPRNFVDATFKIADGDIVQFEGVGTQEKYERRLYARKAGETTYTVSVDGVNYATQKITVKEAPPAFDPPMKNAVMDSYTVDTSKYYYTPDPETGAGGTAALIGSTLYTFRGKEAIIVEKNVKQYDHVHIRTEKGNYLYADNVLTNEGVWKVNGENMTDVKISEIRGEYAISENEKLYMLQPDGDKLKAVVIASGAKYFVPNCEKLYYAKDGTVWYYDKPTLTGKPTLGTTSLTEPLFSENDTTGLAATYYLVDQKNDLYKLEFDHSKYASFKKTKIAANVTDLRYAKEEKGMAVLEYTTPEGEVTPLLKISFGNVSGQAFLWAALDLEVGTFYIHELQSETVTENDAVISYYIDNNRELRFRFLDDVAGLTHVKGELCSTYDAETESGLLWFVREDGSIWSYDLKEKKWQNALENEQPAIYEPGDLNKDNNLTIADAVLMSKHLSGEKAELAQWYAADFNGNNTLDAADFSVMKHLLMITGGDAK